MGILERMRSGSDSTGMQVVLVLVILSFIGFNGRVFGDTSSTVAEVNGTKILDTTYARAYRNAIRMREEDAQRALSDAEQKQLAEEVKQGLIEDEVVLQEARRLGLEVSDLEVARYVSQIPGVRGDDGKFSDDLYEKLLKRMGFTKSDFQERVRDDLLRLKLRLLVATGASVSEPAIRESYVEATTRVELEMVRIRPSVFESAVTITDEERTTWLAANEELVKQTYDRDFDRLYNHPEQVRLRMVRLGVTEGGPPVGELVPRLNALRDRASAGEDLGELAKRWSEDPSAKLGGDLGLRPVGQLNTETAKAVEGLAAGSLSRTFTSASDARFVKVEERVLPKVDTLDEVRNEIADRMIRAERVPVLAAEFAEQQLLPKWRETGAAPIELLQEKGLSVTSTGPMPTRAQDRPGAPPAALLDAARNASVGTVLPEVYESGGVYYVAMLTNRIEPDFAEYEAEKTTIQEQVLLSRRDEFYQAWVDDLKSQAAIQ